MFDNAWIRLQLVILFRQWPYVGTLGNLHGCGARNVVRDWDEPPGSAPLKWD